jgi:SAM-dependent methyltransferase
MRSVVASLRLALVAAHSLLLRASTHYHRWCVTRYWYAGAATHADMSIECFDFYADQIAELLGTPASAGAVLDFGAGRGEIASRLQRRGYHVECTDLAPTFVQASIEAGLPAHQVAELPSGRYDTIYVNNAIFYVHPRLLAREIQRLLELLKPRGRLLLLDIPARERIDMVVESRVRAFICRLSGVYQPAAGGFFVDCARLERRFPSARVFASWSAYRVSIELWR